MTWYLDDSSSVVPQIYAQRRRNFIAAISNNGGTAETILGIAASAPQPETIIAPSEAPQPPAPLAEPSDAHQPPALAEFLLVTIAKSPRAADAMIGCMHERFVRDCANRGPARARLFYWGHTASSVWPLLRRALGRAATWAAIFSAVKRYLVG
jgi:hypothetical protein